MAMNIFKNAKSFAKAAKDVLPGTYHATVSSIIVDNDKLQMNIYATLAGVDQRVKITRWFNSEESVMASSAFLRCINNDAVDACDSLEDLSTALTGGEFIFIQNADRTHRAARIADESTGDGRISPSVEEAMTEVF